MKDTNVAPIRYYKYLYYIFYLLLSKYGRFWGGTQRMAALVYFSILELMNVLTFIKLKSPSYTFEPVTVFFILGVIYFINYYILYRKFYADTATLFNRLQPVRVKIG